MLRPLKEVKAWFYGSDSMPKLLSAEDAASLTGVKAKRLVELADAAMAPCVRIDGGEPQFIKKDIVAWVKHHLVQIQEGRMVDTPIAIQVEYRAIVHADLPKPLRSLLDHLLEHHSSAHPPCVYFLVKDREVVYVGQSVCLPSRVDAHRADKDFDRVYYIPVPRSELDIVEGGFIRALNPPLNRNTGARLPPNVDPLEQFRKPPIKAANIIAESMA